MPRQFSGLGDPLIPLGTDPLWFQTGSRPNVPLRHPNFVEALETLYLTKGDD